MRRGTLIAAIAVALASHGTVVIDELLLGRSAWWARLRGPEAKAKGIPIEAVVEQGEERIVVRV